MAKVKTVKIKTANKVKRARLADRQIFPHTTDPKNDKPKMKLQSVKSEQPDREQPQQEKQRVQLIVPQLS